MHLSLDSALGRQRRLNSVGESVLQIAPNAAAAYSLRSLTGGDPTVARVRRGSDNHEKDFRASEVASGALTSFVNAQTTHPLDIQELEADGRTGDFVIANAAYSLRSLGTRQATVTSSGDTDGDTSGKFVVQVRRNSDDNLKSFTADEITDGTLLSFVGTSGSSSGFVQTWYDQSVTNQAGDTATGNHAAAASNSNQPQIVDGGVLVTGGVDFGQTGNFNRLLLSGSGLDIFKDVGYGQVFTVITPEETSTGNSRYFEMQSTFAQPRFILGDSQDNAACARVGGRRLDGDGFQDIESPTSHGNNETLITGFANWADSDAYLYFNGVEVASSTSFQTNGNTSDTSSNKAGIGGVPGAANADFRMQELIIYNTDQTANRTAIEANMGETYGLSLPSGVDTGYDQVDGFVETWYDQSGNSNDATQSSATSQPKIVDAGSLVLDSRGHAAIDFDNVDDKMDLTSDLVSSGAYTAFAYHEFNAQSMILKGNLNSPRIRVNTSNAYQVSSYSPEFIKNYSVASSKGLISVLKDASHNARVYANGTESTSGQQNVGSGSSPFTNLATETDNSSADGKIMELIYYESDQSANREGIETNINNQYDIY